MTGGIFAVFVLALVDALSNRTPATLRNIVFVLVIGASCVVITGLPEVFFPHLPPQLMMVLRSSLGPAAGAMGVYFLGGWLGGLREDLLVYRLTAWGGAALLLAALALALVASQADLQDRQLLLLVAAGVNAVPIFIGMVVVVRSAALGDPLARWMIPAIVCLIVMVPGFYLRGLKVSGPGLGTWLITAIAAVTYLLIASLLVVLRTRQKKRLARLLRLEVGADPATGLPTGSALLSRIEQDFWRTTRLRGESTVICLYVSNLYELAKSPEHGLEQQILAAMSARIRRAAGFRCTVGVYHPRCFVVVLTTDRHNNHALDTVEALREVVAQPLAVEGEWRSNYTFMPCVGMGVLKIDPVLMKPVDALNKAEQKAMLAAGRSERFPQVDIATAPASLMPCPTPGPSSGLGGSASAY
jgi:GGDEF domain-containing protein